MKQMLLAILLALGLAGDACAGGPEPLGPAQHLTARFRHERLIAGFDTPLVSEGDVVITGAGQLIWRTTSPLASELVVTRTTIAQFLDGQPAMRVPLDAAGPHGQLNGILIGLMTGDWVRLGITPAVEGDGWRAGAGENALPAFLAAQIRRIDARGGTAVDEVTILRRSGDRERFRFHDHRRTEGPLAPADSALLARAEGG